MMDVQKLPLFGNVDLDPDHEPTVRQPARVDSRASQAIAMPPAPANAGQLVRQAWPLIATLARLAANAAATDPDITRQALLGLLKRFERDALQAGISPRPLAAARYTLCTALDEAILQTPWGQSGDWSESTLLNTVFAETWGGEKIFSIIERALAEPEAQGELIELCYFVLLLGFQGRYRLVRDGTAEVDSIRERLLDALRGRRGTPAALQVPQPVVPRRPQLLRLLPVWLVAIGCLAIASLVFGWWSIKLHQHSSQTAAAIEALKL